MCTNHVLTSSPEPSPHSHTLRGTLCRDSVVVGGVFNELLREGDSGCLLHSEGGIHVDRVGIG